MILSHSHCIYLQETKTVRFLLNHSVPPGEGEKKNDLSVLHFMFFP